MPASRPLLYVLAGRWFSGPKDDYNEHLKPGWGAPAKFDLLTPKTPGGFRKTDTNNHGPVSSDFIGANHEWPDACHECREEAVSHRCAPRSAPVRQAPGRA